MKLFLQNFRPKIGHDFSGPIFYKMQFCKSVHFTNAALSRLHMVNFNFCMRTTRSAGLCNRSRAIRACRMSLGPLQGLQSVKFCALKWCKICMPAFWHSAQATSTPRVRARGLHAIVGRSQDCTNFLHVHPLCFFARQKLHADFSAFCAGCTLERVL